MTYNIYHVSINKLPFQKILDLISPMSYCPIFFLFSANYLRLVYICCQDFFTCYSLLNSCHVTFWYYLLMFPTYLSQAQATALRMRERGDKLCFGDTKLHELNKSHFLLLKLFLYLFSFFKPSLYFYKPIFLFISSMLKQWPLFLHAWYLNSLYICFF